MTDIAADTRLRSSVRNLASGRTLVLDYFTSARCGVVVGDITARFGVEPSPDTHTSLGELEGVRLFAERRLVPLLDEAGATLEHGRWPFGGRVRVALQRPDLWLEFLERPGNARHGRRREGDPSA
jgi:hypothetical protein